MLGNAAQIFIARICLTISYAFFTFNEYLINKRPTAHRFYLFAFLTLFHEVGFLIIKVASKNCSGQNKLDVLVKLK